MSCSGLHCAGCVGGAAVPVVPLAAFCGLAWVAEHLVEVVIVSGTCGVLAVAGVVALIRSGPTAGTPGMRRRARCGLHARPSCQRARSRGRRPSRLRHRPRS